MVISKKNKNFKIKNQKLLIVNLRFWPDKSSCSSILFHVATQLAKNIKKVEIITSKPTKFNSNFTNLELKKYYSSKDLRIYRLSLLKENLSAIPRIFNALILAFFASFKLLTDDYKIVIATSSPPILTAFIISIVAKIKKIRFIYYCMDINPEIGILTREFRNPLLCRIMFFIDKLTCINANPTIVHSISMQNTLSNRFENPKININIINSLTVPNNKISKKKDISLKKFMNNGLTIIFAGNIGRFQGLENIIYAFKFLVEHKNIKLILLGEGFEKTKLKKLSKSLGTNVEFIDFVSYDQAKNIIRHADLGLVSLIPNMYKYAYPSKTMAYLEQGIPILAMIENESDLALDIKHENIGFAIPINQHKKLANLLIKLNNNHNWKSNLKKKSLDFYKKKFSDKIIIKKWEKVIFK